MLEPINSAERLNLVLVFETHIQQHVAAFVLLSLLGGPTKPSFANARNSIETDIYAPQGSETFWIDDVHANGVTIDEMSIQLGQYPGSRRYEILCNFSIGCISSGRSDVVRVFREVVADVCRVCPVTDFAFGLHNPFGYLNYGNTEAIFFYTKGDGKAEFRGDVMWGSIGFCDTTSTS